MTEQELRASLREILNAEEQPQVDWVAVEQLCGETIRRLVSEPAPDYPYDVVFHFLDDSDVRQKDLRYAEVQHERLSAWLASSA